MGAVSRAIWQAQPGKVARCQNLGTSERPAAQPNRRRVLLVALAVIVSGAAGYLVSRGPAAPSGPFRVMALSSHTVGAIASTPSGELLYVDLDHDEVDALTPNGPRMVLRGPEKRPATITGLATDGRRIWVGDGGHLYEADLDGSKLHRVPAASGVDAVEALRNGDVLYSTRVAWQSGSIFERFTTGRTLLLVGDARAGDGESPYQHPVVGVYSAVVYPTSFALANNGVLSMVDSANILEQASGSVVTEITAAGAFNGAELTASPSGVVYGVVFRTIDRIGKGALARLGAIPSRIDGQFEAPVSVASAPDGGLYLSYTDEVGSPRSAWRSGIVRINDLGASKPLLESRPS
jgi:hypothetical protein